ncbi:MAG: hypothetical protein RIB59_01720 [Rhodospirillales bacterium]
MPVETIGAPTIIPPTPSGTESRTVPTNAGVFQAEIATDSVAQQVQQVQSSSAQTEASNQQRQTENNAQQGRSNDQAEARSESGSGNASSSEGRGGTLDIEV